SWATSCTVGFSSLRFVSVGRGRRVVTDGQVPSVPPSSLRTPDVGRRGCRWFVVGSGDGDVTVYGSAYSAIVVIRVPRNQGTCHCAGRHDSIAPPVNGST